MEIKSVLLMRVSSVVDKEVDHPQFFDPSYPLKYLQAGLEKYGRISVHVMDCSIHPMNVSQMRDYTRSSIHSIALSYHFHITGLKFCFRISQPRKLTDLMATIYLWN